VIILFRNEFLIFIKTIPNIQLSIRPAYVFLMIIFLIAMFLVLVLKHDLRFDKTIDRNYYLQFPGISKTLSIIKTWMKYFVITIVVTFLLSWIWNKIPQLPPNAFFPEFDFSNFKINQMVSLDWFWWTATLIALVVFVIDIIRNIRSPLWDVFISYKSQNVDLARAITNRLIASGLKVWFAEYQILLVGRAKFQQAIDKGIRQSRFGIALTNDEYAKSDYCGLEMKQLLQHPGPGHILEIKIPDEPLTHQKFNRLVHASQQVYRGELESILTFISQKTNWRIIPPMNLSPVMNKEVFIGEFLGSPYQLDVSGWEQVERSFHGGGPCYSSNIEGYPIYWNLQYGEEYSPEIYESRSSLSQKNDRQLYNMLVDYANHYFRDLKSGSTVQGVHLFFLGNSSHFAVTYQAERIWKRRYSIMLVHPVSGKVAEFLFTFEFNGDYLNYCRASHIMDDLVRSLTWGNSEGEAAKGTPASVPAPSVESTRFSRLIDDQAKVNKLNAEGLAFAKSGLLDDAIATWEKVLDFSMVNELRSQVFFNLGRAYEKSGEKEKAINRYQECVKANPAQYNALCNIGSIYMDYGDHYKALEFLVAAEKINPADYVTVNNLVICYNELEDFDEAFKWKEKLKHLSM